MFTINNGNGFPNEIRFNNGVKKILITSVAPGGVLSFSHQTTNGAVDNDSLVVQVPSNVNLKLQLDGKFVSAIFKGSFATIQLSLSGGATADALEADFQNVIIYGFQLSNLKAKPETSIITIS